MSIDRFYIDPNEVKETPEGKVLFPVLIKNGVKIDLIKNPTTKFTDTTTFDPKITYKMNVDTSNTNESSYIIIGDERQTPTNNAFNLRVYKNPESKWIYNDFKLNIKFSLPESMETSKPQTLFFNTNGYLHVYLKSSTLFIEIIDPITKTIKNIFVKNRSRNATIKITDYVEGALKNNSENPNVPYFDCNIIYDLKITKILNTIESSLDIYRYEKSSNPKDSEVFLKSISASPDSDPRVYSLMIGNQWSEDSDDGKIGLGSLTDRNGDSYKVTWIGINPEFEKTNNVITGLNLDKWTNLFTGWIHYFNIQIENLVPIDVPLFDGSKGPNSGLLFNIENNKINNQKLLDIGFNIEGKVNKPILNLDYWLSDDPTEVRKVLFDGSKGPNSGLLFNIENNKINNQKLLDIEFNIEGKVNEPIINLEFDLKKEKPKDPGPVRYEDPTERIYLKHIGPYNYPKTKFDTKRDFVFPREEKVKSETLYFSYPPEDDEEPEVADNGNIVFEMAHTNVVFIEIDPETNTLLLCKKDTLDSEREVLTSFSQVLGNVNEFTEKWNHIAITYNLNTNELSLFLNGKKAYTTTDVPNLNWGYMQFNTFKNDDTPTYFTGVTITDEGNYIDNFVPSTGISGSPLTPFANVISVPRSVKILHIPSRPGIIFTGHIVDPPGRILHIYTGVLPVVIYNQKLIFISATLHAYGHYIQTYLYPPGSVQVWKGARVFGPLTNNINNIFGKIFIYPAYLYSSETYAYSSIVKYAESWTLEFWYLRVNFVPSQIIDIVEIGGPYGKFLLSTKIFMINNGASSHIVKDTWNHIAVVFNVLTGILKVFINGVCIYYIEIRLPSPEYFIFFIGFDPNDGNFIADIELIKGIKYPGDFPTNPDPDDKDAETPENPEEVTYCFNTERNVEMDPIREVIFYEGGIDENIIDYRLFMYRIATVNTAFPNNTYGYDVKYINCKYIYNKTINIGPDPEHKWLQVRSMGPSNSGSLGYIYYKSEKELLNNYTVDFWVYKTDNTTSSESPDIMSLTSLDSLESNNDKLTYPLIDIIGAGNKVKILLTNTTIEYYSYANGNWNLETLNNNKTSNLVNTWTHIALTYDLPSKILSVFINGENYIDSQTFTSLPLEEMSIYTNTINSNTHYLTSIRISSRNEFPEDDFDMNKVNHPYGPLLLFETDMELKCPPKIVYDGDIKFATKRNVIIGGGPFPPSGLPVGPSGEPIGFNKRGLPWTHTKRKIVDKDVRYEDKTIRKFIKTIKRIQNVWRDIKAIPIEKDILTIEYTIYKDFKNEILKIDFQPYKPGGSTGESGGQTNPPPPGRGGQNKNQGNPGNKDDGVATIAGGDHDFHPSMNIALGGNINYQSAGSNYKN